MAGCRSSDSIDRAVKGFALFFAFTMSCFENENGSHCRDISGPSELEKARQVNDVSDTESFSLALVSYFVNTPYTGNPAVNAIGILIIEGNPHLRSLLGWHLQQVGYSVRQASSLAQAKNFLEAHQPTLVVLDADLPGGNCIEFCRWIHQQRGSNVVILSERASEKDVVTALKMGADDYITKPFGMQEFMARIEVLVRRLQASTAPLQLDYGALNIDLVQRRIRLHDEFIDLTPQEFSLIYVLAQARGAALSRLELLRRAWPEAIDNPRTIDTHILSLRKKIEHDPRQPLLIQTVRSVGYRLNMEAVGAGEPFPGIVASVGKGAIAHRVRLG